MESKWSFDFGSSNLTQLLSSMEPAPSETQFSICKMKIHGSYELHT